MTSSRARIEALDPKDYFGLTIERAEVGAEDSKRRIRGYANTFGVRCKRAGPRFACLVI